MKTEVETSCDAFHRGAFHLIQPKTGAHRAGIDAMLLAASVKDDTAFKLADFGAGVGAVGLAVASRCQKAEITLIERDPAMAHLAVQTLKRPENAHLADRVSVQEADVAQLPNTQADANSFDWVVMNPPFNDPKDRATPHAGRSDAHVMPADLFNVWLRKASTILHAKGRMALIARPFSLHEILIAAERRFGAIRIVPVLPRADEAA
ncbi:MAG: methyltransferase, partial [Pseudomonadota bacterium]